LEEGFSVFEREVALPTRGISILVKTLILNPKNRTHNKEHLSCIFNLRDVFISFSKD